MFPVPARFAVPGFGLAAGACALVLAGVGSARSATTLTFKELTKGSTFVFVDNAPASKTKGEPAASAGDVIVFTNPLVNGGRRIGRLYMHCTAVVAAPAANKASFGCEGVVGLGEGTLTIQVFLPHAGATVHGVVTGGTGTYANARGTLVSRPTKTGADDAISLVK